MYFGQAFFVGTEEFWDRVADEEKTESDGEVEVAVNFNVVLLGFVGELAHDSDQGPLAAAARESRRMVGKSILSSKNIEEPGCQNHWISLPQI